jgi:tape measure domain-containing protein
VPDFAVKTAFTAVDRISPAFKNMSGEASKFEKTASRAFLAIGSFVSGYLINSFVEAASQLERLNTGFKSVFGGDAGTQMQFVREEAKRLGLDLMTSADAYKSIAAAAKGTAISNADVQQTFLGVSEAAAALQLSSEQSQGALLAISQIISKGKVSMEELRGQLGERIPGAMQIAARAMGVTTAELEKLVASGIPAEKFIPRFAAQMRKEFGPAATDAANSFNASRNRFNNMVFDFKVGIGSVILPMLNDLMTAFAPALNLMIDFFKENKDGISAVVKLIPWVVSGFLAWKVALWGVFIAQQAIIGIGWIKYLWMMRDVILGAILRTKALVFIQWALNSSTWANAASTVANTIATWGAQAALWALEAATWAAQAATWAFNAALNANPIGLVIAAVAALAGSVYLIYRNWGAVSGWFSEMWARSLAEFNYFIDYMSNKLDQFGNWAIGKWQAVKGFFGFGEGDVNVNNAPNKVEAEGKYNNNTTVNINNKNVESKVTTNNKRDTKIKGDLGTN